MAYKAVVFDMGGVMVDFKWPERIPVLITQLRSNPDQLEQFLKCEVGEIPLSEIAWIFNTGFPGLKDVQDFENLDFDEFFGPVNPIIYQAAKKLKASGIKVGILSNNYFLSDSKSRTTCVPEIYEFDEAIESCRVKTRKPNRDIFDLMVSKLGVKHEECIFIDDLESNVKGGEDAGIKALHMRDREDSERIVEELEKLFNLDLKQ